MPKSLRILVRPFSIGLTWSDHTPTLHKPGGSGIGGHLIEDTGVIVSACGIPRYGSALVPLLVAIPAAGFGLNRQPNSVASVNEVHPLLCMFGNSISMEGCGQEGTPDKGRSLSQLMGADFNGTIAF
jgi:hypothetical protein